MSTNSICLNGEKTSLFVVLYSALSRTVMFVTFKTH